MKIRTFLRLSLHTQLLPILESGEETLVGGQAVMEGVMMRAPHSYAVAVRKANGRIVMEESAIPRVSEKYPIFRFPLLRGIGTLGQAMWLGMRALSFSAGAALDESTAESTAESAAGEASEQTPQHIPGWMLAVNVAISLLFFVFLYKFVPLFLATQVGRHVPGLNGRLAINLVDGILRILIFIGFLSLLALMKDMRRVFEYHGAEHKVVFNFESGQPVTVANAQKFVTWHPRCGTSFLLVVLVLAMLIYALVPVDGFTAKLVSRIALMPLIVGVSYELIRLAAKRRRGLLHTLTAPGLWLQRITTKPPSDEQTAVAIDALNGAMALEKAQGGELVIA
ncbi:MAG: DUF1385 domain-containing protein [Bryobacteraceae bacterium]